MFIENGVCVESCSPGNVDVGNFICGCPNILLLGKCIPSCPAATYAPVTAPAVVNTAKIIALGPKDCICTNDQFIGYFTSDSTYTCYPTCPAGTIPNFLKRSCDPAPCKPNETLQGGICKVSTTLINPDGTNLVGSCDGDRCIEGNICIPLPENKVIGTDLKCVSYCVGSILNGKKCTACSGATPLFTGVDCKASTATCITGAVKVGTTNVCKCDKKFLSNNICENACPANTFIDSANALCLPMCMNGSVNGKCIRCLPNEEYDSSSPNGCRLRNCKDFSLGGFCVPECPKEMSANIFTKRCECPQGHFYDPVGKCVKVCLLGRKPNFNNNLCECEIGKPLKDDNTCVFSCPDSKFEDIINGICAPERFENCLNDPLTIKIKGECRCKGPMPTLGNPACFACALDKFFEVSSTALDPCTDCTGGYKIVDKKVCVKKCPNLIVESTKTCVDTCPSGTFVNLSNNNCDACPAGTSPIDGICRCTEVDKAFKSDYTCDVCPSNIINKKGICLTKCDLLLEGKTCTDRCSDNKVLFGRLCIDKCNGYYDVDDNYKCIKVCNKLIDGNFCRRFCSFGKIVDNSRCVCQEGFALNEETNSCIKLKCRLGEEISITGECVKCQPGSYNSGLFLKCKKCPKGMTSNQQMSMCVKGATQIQPQSSIALKPEDCAFFRMIPNYLNNGCMYCPDGKYLHKGTNTCQLCENGYTSSSETFGFCLKCKLGTQWNNGSSICEPCSGAMYRPDGEDTCIPCIGGVINSARTECIPCPPKTIQVTNVCQACEINEIAINNMCTPCGPREKPAKDQNRCEACPPGKSYDMAKYDCI